VTVVEGDATAGPLAPRFDRVLVDAPCSDLGALASRPDARWRKSPRAIQRLEEAQARILEQAVGALRPGGVLVYSTCTISRRENEDRVAELLSASGSGELPALDRDASAARGYEKWRNRKALTRHARWGMYPRTRHRPIRGCRRPAWSTAR